MAMTVEINTVVKFVDATGVEKVGMVIGAKNGFYAVKKADGTVSYAKNVEPLETIDTNKEEKPIIQVENKVNKTNDVKSDFANTVENHVETKLVSDSTSEAEKTKLVSGSTSEAEKVYAFIRRPEVLSAVLSLVRSNAIDLDIETAKALMKGISMPSPWEEYSVNAPEVQLELTAAHLQGHNTARKEFEYRLKDVKNIVVGGAEKNASRWGMRAINGGKGFEVGSGLRITHMSVTPIKNPRRFPGATAVAVATVSWIYNNIQLVSGRLYRSIETGEYFVRDYRTKFKNDEGEDIWISRQKFEGVLTKDAPELLERLIGEVAAHVHMSTTQTKFSMPAGDDVDVKFF